MSDKVLFDREFLLNEYCKICGVDEVGRGCLFGPVVAAAVIMPISINSDIVEGIADSKKLTDKKRRELADIIKTKAISYSVAEVSVEEIDKINIYNATKIAMLNAIEGLNVLPDILLIDAMKLNTRFKEYSIIKGDDKSYSIGVASILAKVYRDDLMISFSKKYIEYSLEKNKGYGTKSHLEAIEKYGITPLHRKTFSPVKEMIGSKNERDKSIFE